MRTRGRCVACSPAHGLRLVSLVRRRRRAVAAVSALDSVIRVYAVGSGEAVRKIQAGPRAWPPARGVPVHGKCTSPPFSSGQWRLGRWRWTLKRHSWRRGRGRATSTCGRSHVGRARGRRRRGLKPRRGCLRRRSDSRWRWHTCGHAPEGEAAGFALGRIALTSPPPPDSQSPNGRLVASGHKDGAVCVMDVADQRLLHRLQPAQCPARALAFSRDSRTLFVGTDDGAVRAFDTCAPRGVWCGGPAYDPFHLPPPFSAQRVLRRRTAVEPARTHGLAHCHCHTCQRQIYCHVVRSRACDPDARTHALVTALSLSPAPAPRSSTDRSVRVWDLERRSPAHTFDAQHRDQVWGVSFHPTDGLLASAGDDGAIQLYQVE